MAIFFFDGIEEKASRYEKKWLRKTCVALFALLKLRHFLADHLLSYKYGCYELSVARYYGSGPNKTVDLAQTVLFSCMEIM